MLLAVNIGNSNIRFGLCYGSAEVRKSWTFNTKPYKTKDELFLMFKSMYEQQRFDASDVTDIVIGSVVPHQTRLVQDALQEIHGIAPTVVDRNTPTAVKHSSGQMGTDLYANAVAAYSQFPNKNTVIVDFGTALTLTAVDSTGEVLGVIIAPGVITSLRALIGETAQLPDIPIEAPKQLLGKDTITCMQSGIVYGYISMVEGFIQRINQQLNTTCHVISTGGLGHIFQPMTSIIDTDDKYHTLRGLCYLYQHKKSAPLPPAVDHI